MTPRSNKTMLDFVRATSGIPEDAQYEGEFHPDPEQVEAWRQEPDTSYDGCWRYVNLGPMEVRRRLGAEQNPSEKMALQKAFEFWQLNKGYSSGIEAGTVDRGQPMEARVVGSLREAVGGQRVEHIFVTGSLSSEGLGALTSDGGRLLGMDVIDYDFLMRESKSGGVPQGDWF